MANWEFQTAEKMLKNEIYNQWTDALIVFASIYLETKALGLAKYINDIQQAAA